MLDRRDPVITAARLDVDIDCESSVFTTHAHPKRISQLRCTIFSVWTKLRDLSPASSSRLKDRRQLLPLHVVARYWKIRH